VSISGHRRTPPSSAGGTGSRWPQCSASLISMHSTYTIVA
jgi:hypothetical protein